MEKSVDLRGHHFITLSSLYLQRRLLLPHAFSRKMRAGRLAAQGYAEAEAFNDHLMQVVGDIIDGNIQQVRIVADHDEICKGCQQGRSNHCVVNGRKWSADFLEMADRAIVENTNGLIEIDETYPSRYLIDNIWLIRLAILKTAPQIPGLLRFT